MLKKISIYLYYLFMVAFSISIIAILISGIYYLYYISNNYHILFIPVFLTCILLVTIISLLLIFIFNKMNILNYKYIPYILFIISFLIELLFVFFVDTPIKSDFVIQYQTALDILSNNHEYLSKIYFIKWPSQIGFSIYEALLLKIYFSKLFLKVVNCLLSSFIIVFVYKISSELFSSKSSLFVSILYIFSMFPRSYVTVLANNIPAAFFIYLSLYLLICKPLKKHYLELIIVAICLGISSILRSETILIIVPFIIYEIFVFLHNFDYKKLFTCLLVVLSIYMSVGQGATLITQNLGITNQGLKSHMTLYKFAVGLNYSSKGSYSKALSKEISQKEKNGQDSNDVLVKMIYKYKPNSIKEWIQLFNHKIFTYWIAKTSNWSLDSLDSQYSITTQQLNYLLAVINIIDTLFSYIIVIFLIPLIINYFKNTTFHYDLLLLFFMFTTFFVFLFIEVQPRYVYIIQPCIYILLAGGIDSVVSNSPIFNELKIVSRETNED